MKIWLKEDKEETPVNKLVLETVYLLELGKGKCSGEIKEKLGEWGFIEMQGKTKRRMKRMTTKGIRKALHLSLAMEGGEDDEV